MGREDKLTGPHTRLQWLIFPIGEIYQKCNVRLTWIYIKCVNKCDAEKYKNMRMKECNEHADDMKYCMVCCISYVWYIVYYYVWTDRIEAFMHQH